MTTNRIPNVPNGELVSNYLKTQKRKLILTHRKSGLFGRPGRKRSVFFINKNNYDKIHYKVDARLIPSFCFFIYMNNNLGDEKQDDLHKYILLIFWGERIFFPFKNYETNDYFYH